MPTVKELKAEAKSKGIKGFSTMKKAELEKAVGGGAKKKGGCPPGCMPVPKKATKKAPPKKAPPKKAPPKKKASAPVDEKLIRGWNFVSDIIKDRDFYRVGDTIYYAPYDDMTPKKTPLTAKYLLGFKITPKQKAQLRKILE